MEVRLTHKQSQGLSILEDERYSEILFDGGVRAGKTFLTILYLIKFALSVAGVDILIGRRFFEHCRKSLYIQTIEPLLDQFPSDYYHVNKQSWIIEFKNKSQIWLSGFDDSKRVNEIMGREYLMAFLNEATEINEEMVDKVTTRLAQKVSRKDGGYYKPRLLFDCNPIMPEFYLFKRFMTGAADLKRLNWSTYDNKVNLTSDYLMKLESSLGELEKRRLIYGEWVGYGELIYRGITESAIIEKYDVGSFTHLVGGIDWGYVSAFSLWGINGRDAVCIAEVESKGKITNEFLEEVEARIGKIKVDKDKFMVYCDTEPDRIEEAKRKGFRARKAYKDVSAGDSTVNWYNIRIHRDCINVYRSMRFLQNEKNRAGDIIEGKHEKVDDHSADCARYALHSHRMEYGDRQGEVEISSVGWNTEDLMKML